MVGKQTGREKKLTMRILIAATMLSEELLAVEPVYNDVKQ